MSVHLLRLSPVGIAFLLVVAILGGATVLAQAQDAADDPLPKGAAVRFGVTRPILRTGPGVALLPPRYTDFLAPTMTGGIRRYDLATGRPLDKMGIVGPGQVVVSADGKRAAVAKPGAIKVVDVATGKEVLAVEPPEGVIIVGIPGVSLSEDGKVLAYGGRGQDKKGAVVVWDVDRNEILSHVDTVLAAPVYPTLSRDGKKVVTHGPPLPAPTLKETNPAKPPPAKAVVAADVTRTAQVWEVVTAKELFKARLTGMGGSVVAAAFSPDGDVVALSAGDGPVDLWDVKTGRRRHTLLGRKAQGVRVAFSPDGKTVAAIGTDYRVQRWSADGKPLGISEPPAGGMLVAPITGLTFADNERVIGWQTAAQFAVAWEGDRLLSPAGDHVAAIRSIAFPEGAKDPFTSGLDGRVFRWNLATGQLSETIELQPARIPAQPLTRPVVNLSAAGTRAIWVRPTSEVFDLTTGADLFCIPSPTSPPAPVTYTLSPDGMKLTTISRQSVGRRNGLCVIWDLTTQQRVAEFDVFPSVSAAAPGAALSRDNRRLVVATAARNQDGREVLKILSYDVKTGKKLGEVDDPSATGSITVAVANDTTAVIASVSGRVWSVDFATGKIGDDIDRITTRGEPPVHGPIAISPDGKRFATGVVGEPYTIYGVRIYDLPQRKMLHTFLGHLGPVSALHFSPDGNLLASGAQDTSVLVWDMSKLR